MLFIIIIKLHVWIHNENWDINKHTSAMKCMQHGHLMSDGVQYIIWRNTHPVSVPITHCSSSHTHHHHRKKCTAPHSKVSYPSKQTQHKS